jgi:hypothetical protein
MKVLFKNLINGYTGMADDLVFYYHRKLNKVIVRRKPKTKINWTNIEFAAVAHNLKRIHPSQGYKDDFSVYCDQYSRLKENEFRPVPCWFNLYMILMYKMAKADPEHIDLKTITRDQIETNNLPCRSVKQAIEAGLLPPVRSYENLYHYI